MDFRDVGRADLALSRGLEAKAVLHRLLGPDHPFSLEAVRFLDSLSTAPPAHFLVCVRAAPPASPVTREAPQRRLPTRSATAESESGSESDSALDSESDSESDS